MLGGLTRDPATQAITGAAAMRLDWRLVNNGSLTEVQRDTPTYACAWELEVGNRYVQSSILAVQPAIQCALDL